MLINLTPHDLDFFDKDNNFLLKLPKSAEMPTVRVNKTLEYLHDVDVENVVLPLYEAKFNDVENLPEPQEGTVYIVSNIALQAIREQYPDRNDFYAPDEPVRDEGGAIIGCRILTKL